MSDASARFPLAALAGASGFQLNSRFAPSPGARRTFPHEPSAQPEDPKSAAYAEGYAAGLADAQAAAEERANDDAQAREALGLSFARLDKQLEEEFRLKLRDTVAALCEAAIAPLALDQDALMQRIERATSMLRRADDERVVRLHPDDIALVSPRLTSDWQVVPDPALERGALRMESGNGGVEDGPDSWRRAIAEALHQC
jgi:flagellar assembly protein FliH